MKNYKNFLNSRREFLRNSLLSVGALSTIQVFDPFGELFRESKPVVSIVKIKDDRVDLAVEKAIDLLGGIKSITKGMHKIMLKPNLVADDPNSTTKPVVIRTLATLMKTAGKEVLIGEGSAAAGGINADNNGVYFTRKPELLDKLQQQVFDKLGYTEMAKELNIPLINLHTGEMVEVEIPDAHLFKKLTIHKSLSEIDLLCSVPMMKTHALATVTLGMKNLIGLYPGSAYCSVRSCVHEMGENAGSPGVAFEILDMVKANKLGLTVIDGSMAMEGDGPSMGPLVKMDVIIAGTNSLATDMVGAAIMGFQPNEVPTFELAHKSGMKPFSMDEIEIRGEKIETVMRKFVRPNVVPFHDIKSWFGAKEV
jgi:uncharacterized protein (DUF362 family)